MTFPIHKHLSDYPFIGKFPFHLSRNRVEQHFPQHRHDFFEFSYILEGEGSEAVNGEKHPLKPGTFTFILPYQVHEIFAMPGKPLILMNCMFGLELLGEATEKLLLSEHNPIRTHYDLAGESEQEIRRLLERMEKEYATPDFWQQAMLKGMLTELVAHLERSHRQPRPDAPPESGSLQPPTPAWDLMRYIHIHYREPLTLAHLGARFQCHPTRITQILTRHFGVSFLSLLQEVRIRHACSLLASTDMKVVDIAYEVGYESFSSFSRNFLRKTGVSPTEYRVANRELPRS
ncbi:AraC family transcriptional regulator [Gorillibacterium sp. sgz5001074]|uniref:AraC family transcriptional regulator n=1 Tax=Gorillibacterium sp. sgz5001074 TaxID=3446695 RepID=UPI003F676321